jgi:hypothetical protein
MGHPEHPGGGGDPRGTPDREHIPNTPGLQFGTQPGVVAVDLVAGGLQHSPVAHLPGGEPVDQRQPEQPEHRE